MNTEEYLTRIHTMSKTSDGMKCLSKNPKLCNENEAVIITKHVRLQARIINKQLAIKLAVIDA